MQGGASPSPAQRNRGLGRACRPTGLEELLARAAACIHVALHPLSTLLGRLLGLRVPGDVDLAAWALLSWLLGSRESEALRKLGFIMTMFLFALAVVEAALAG